MKLVGATDWFIRWPFVIEGTIVGAVGRAARDRRARRHQGRAARSARQQLDADRGAAARSRSRRWWPCCWPRASPSRRSAPACRCAASCGSERLEPTAPVGSGALGRPPRSLATLSRDACSSRRARSPRIAAYAWRRSSLVLVVGRLARRPSELAAVARPQHVRSTTAASGQLVHERARTCISRDYYRKVNAAELVNKGLAAAVASLNDPYSHYFDPGRLPRTSRRRPTRT